MIKNTKIMILIIRVDSTPPKVTIQPPTTTSKV